MKCAGHTDNAPISPAYFPHSDVTYYAIWGGNSNEPFDCTVMHYRDLDSTRNSNTEEAATSNAWLDQGSTWNSAAQIPVVHNRAIERLI